MEIGSKKLSLAAARHVTFRPVTAEDQAFLLAVYRSTRLEELAQTGWGEAQREAFLQIQFTAQQTHYRQHYPTGEHWIILLNNQAVGRLYVANIAGEIRVLDVTVLPPSRNAGIGAAIIKELMAEGAALGKPLRIYVENFNRSQRLFERLGFLKIGESGYSDLLEWRSDRLSNSQ
jgi:GNAT superfamily N-acetyltransferase